MNSIERIVAVAMDHAAESRFEFDDLIAALRNAVQERAKSAKASPDDYSPQEYDYWQEQAYETRQQDRKELVREAYGQIGAAVVQSIPSDDQTIMEHVRTAHKMLGLAVRLGDKVAVA